MLTKLSNNAIVSVIRDSFQEYEGEHSLIVFYLGCNLNCRYCYNKRIKEMKPIKGDFGDILDTYITPLHTAVVLLGGEPTFLHSKTIPGDIRYAKEKGLKVKMFTNGLDSKTLYKCIQAGLDAVSIDVKFGEYHNSIIGVQIDIDYHRRIETSISMAVKWGVETEIRTTLWDGITDYEESNVRSIGKDLSRKYKIKHHFQEDFSSKIPYDNL